jgi:rubrerythrin
MKHERNEAINWREISIEEILERAIADEEESRDYYKHAAECAGSIHTRRMLMNLSEMEQTHADQLKKELEDLLLQREIETGMVD